MYIELREAGVKIKLNIRTKRKQGCLGNKSSVPQRRDEMKCWSQHHHKQKLSWKPSLESRQLDFWKLDEEDLMAREGERLKLQNKVRH